MDKHTLAMLASQPPLEPLKIDPASIALSGQRLDVQSGRSWCQQGAWGALYAPPQTQHVMTVERDA